MTRELTSPRMGRWPGGVNNVLDLQDLQRGETPSVRAGVNVDFTDTGKPLRRQGYEKLFSGDFHSLWSRPDWPYALVVGDNILRKVTYQDDQFSLENLATVEPERYMAYALMNDSVYVANGRQAARISRAGVLLPWGVPHPGGQPTLSAVAGGGLDAGRYLVAITFEDAEGEESGSEIAVGVDVAAGGGITLTNIPQPPALHGINIYCSRANGDALYAALQIDAGNSTVTLQREHVYGDGRMLETMLHDRVPASDYLAAYRGRIYFGKGDTLSYTAALRYGLYKRHQEYFRFPVDITGVVDSIDGLFVGTESGTYALIGGDPTNMEQRLVDPFGVVPGTMTKVRGTAFGNRGAQNDVCVWWNNNGELVRGDPGGSTTYLTRGRVALPRFSRGATMHREIRGISQLMSILNRPQGDTGFRARDTAVAEVIRNGVSI